MKNTLPLLCALALSVGGCAVLRGTKAPTSAGPTASDQAMQYFVKAKVFEAQYNYLGAIVALRNAADLDSTSPTIYARLAYNYQRIDDPHMAVHFALKGLALDGSQVGLRRLLIRILESEGEREDAIDHIEELLRYEPDNWPLYRHLAYLYFETGQAERVAPLFKEVARSRAHTTRGQGRYSWHFFAHQPAKRGRAHLSPRARGRPYGRGRLAGAG